MTKTKLILGTIMAVVLSGCLGPAQVPPIVEIEPHQTAFVVSLEADVKAGQAKLDSLSFLASNKIATRRYTVPVRQLNTWWLFDDYQWIPAQRVMIVDRTPITREYTDDRGSGGADRSMHFESLDSMGLHIGVNITTEIVEGDAHLYLYYFGANPHRGEFDYVTQAMPLSKITDDVVYGWIQAKVTSKFGRLQIAKIASSQNRMLDEITTEARTYFKKRGISIVFLGWSGGPKFENPAIQEAVDGVFVARNDIIVANNEQEALVTEAFTELARAQAERDAALNLYDARDAAAFATDLRIRRIRAEVRKQAAAAWDGAPPKIAPAGAAISFGLDKPFDENAVRVDFGGFPVPQELRNRLRPLLEAERNAVLELQKRLEPSEESAAAAAAIPGLAPVAP